jgi:autotransporter-associated beta strand protein
LVDNGSIAQIPAPITGGTAQIAAAPTGAVAFTLTIGTTVPGSTVQLLGTLTLGNPLIIGTNGTFRFSGGTLFGAGGVIQNNGTIVFDAQGGNQTLVHDITGSGTVTVNIGGGILAVSSNNTYSGATTVFAGTLQARSTTAFSPNSAFTLVTTAIPGASPAANPTLDLNGFNNTIGSLSGTGVVLNNGAATATLTVGNDGTSTTFGGVLENGTSVLQLAKIGAGTLTLTGTNTYTGGTTISAGTLQIGNGGTIGSIVGDVTDNAVLAFDRSDSVTFGGAISGTGDVVNLGTGTLTLTGTNTYSGGTTISAGTLQAGSAASFSPNSAFTVNSILDLNGFNNTIGSLSGNGTVLNNGATTATLTAGNDNTNTTFGGVLKDGTSVLQLTKSGTGTFTLTGANSYTGTTTVNSGSLIVDGSIASAQTLVNAGGFLGGHGTIGGNLVNNGIVGQVNSPGTLTVSGNYTQNTGGTLRIGVAGLAPGQHDLLAVNGHAAVAGTLQFIRLGSFNLQPGNQITFLTANNGVSGTFGTVQNGLGGTGTIVQVQVISQPNSVVLEGTQGSFTQVLNGLLTSNEVAVAKMLDSAVGDPREAQLFAFLNSQPLSALPNDLNQIAPVQNTSFRATTVSHGNAQVSNLGGRMSAIHAGVTGFTAMGFGLPGGAVSYGEGLQGENGPEGKAAPPAPAPTPQNRWGVFFTGLGEFTDINSTPQAAGYNVNTGGFTAGVDYRLTSFLAVGLTAGYSHTGINIDQNGGNINVNSGQFGLYATAWTRGFYLDAAISGGPNGYNSHRNALQGSANGDTSGPSFNVLAAVGYDWTHGPLTIGPTASFQFGYVGLNEFSESGSLAPLKFPNQNSESERTAFGAKATYDWQVGHMHLLPQFSAAWQHEYGDTAYSIVANLASGAGNSFTVVGPETGRDSLLIGAGVSVLLNDRVTTYIYYDGEFARTNYLGNAVTAGVRVTF